MAQQLPFFDCRPPSRGRRARLSAMAVVPSQPEVLVEIAGADWEIDARTKEVGLAGVAAARLALAAARAAAAA